MAEPIVFRKFQLTDLTGNHNKAWSIKFYADGRCVTSYGRVGDAGQSTEHVGWTEWDVDDKIAEKLRKGYREIDLNKGQVTKATGVVVGSSRVEAFVANIFAEAGEYVQSYLSVGVDELSERQIGEGRHLLREIQAYLRPGLQGSRAHIGQVELYYNTIPTQLPRKIDPVKLADEFNLSEQEDRLNQLEAALSTFTSQASGSSQYAALGAEIEEIDHRHKAYDPIMDYLNRTGEHLWTHVDGIYRVRIPAERAAYEAETLGKTQVTSLWHGTKAQNVRHILKSGFKIPDMYSNGWMFGPGIYLADKAAKSIRYTASNRGPKMMFLSDAAVGTPYIAKEAQSFRSPPSGYHSVMGKAGHTTSYGGKLLNNEYILYRPSQTTIRFIVAFR